MNDLVIKISCDGKVWTELTEITASKMDLALGMMEFQVSEISPLMELFGNDGNDILVNWGANSGLWFELKQIPLKERTFSCRFAGGY